jgi:hypothetical protein
MSNIFDSLKEISDVMEEIRVSRERECDNYWDKLPMEEKEMAFYSVVKRLFDGDVEKGGSYRYVLYNTFGFEPNMYADGMDCGYMTIHNMLYDAKDLRAMMGVNRFEVIDSNGRSYVNYLKKNESIEFSLQDDEKTLKVFIDDVFKKDV